VITAKKSILVPRKLNRSLRYATWMTLALWISCGCRKHEVAPCRSVSPVIRNRAVPQTTEPSGAQANNPNQINVEVHYAPDEDLEAIDVGLLRSAKRSIDMSAYSFTDPKIAAVLAEQARRGVAVRIYRDHESTIEELHRDPQPLILLLAQTPNIEVRVKHSTTLAHLKAFAIDGQILRSGSANFSPGAEERQDNDLVILRNKGIASAFEAKFDEMWSRSDNETIR
jgi:phosphatidylserine/phosphatidylglycerophosphate/cardiolipin synthase-like enzyme